MAAVCSSHKNVEEDTCVICCNKFKISGKGFNWPDFLSVDAGKLGICSSLCRLQLQYSMGIIHGFLLCDILCNFIANGNSVKNSKSGVQFPEDVDVHDKNSSIINVQCRESSDITTMVKKEESCSDLEDFDCTVSFQNDVQYGDGVATDKKAADPNTLLIPVTNLPNKSTVSVRRRVRSCVRTNITHFSECANARKKQNAHLSTMQDAQKEISLKLQNTKVFRKQSVNDLNKKRIKNTSRTGKKLSFRLKRKWKGSNAYLDTENPIEGQSKEKNQKVVEDDREVEETAENVKTEIGEDTALHCEFCSKLFTAKRFLQRHLNRFHPKQIEISCDICGDSCKNQKYLNTHMRKEHNLRLVEGEELFHCDQCPKSFNSRRGLALHKEFVHSQENPVNCKLCNLTLKNETYLKRHMKRSHSDSIICDICGAKFKSRLALTSHLSAHKGVKSYFCEVCGMGFVRKTSLRRHVQQHNDISYACDSCSSSYKTFGSLSLHMLQIHQRGSYFNNRLKSLEKLGYTVDTEAVNRHLNGQCVACGEKLVCGVCAAHPASYALMFKCHRCELTAEHVDDLLAHLRDHNSGTSSSSICVSFDCKVCHKVFPRKLYLNQHLKKHHPGASMTSLTLHPATLTYCCQICGKHFQQKQYLYVHMKQHLQPGSFACHVCDRKFTYKCNLKNHLMTHSEDKPFKCDVCFKPFRRKEVLNSHRLVHNPNQSPFKCHICGKGLSRKQYLKKHYQIMHPESQESHQAPPPPLPPLSQVVPSQL